MIGQDRNPQILTKSRNSKYDKVDGVFGRDTTKYGRSLRELRVLRGERHILSSPALYAELRCACAARYV